MREDWTDKLKRKLDGHRKTPPPDLWESINTEMGFEIESVSQKSVIKWWPWAAAAVILALVGLFVFQKIADEQPLQQPLQAEVSSLVPVSPQVEAAMPQVDVAAKHEAAEPDRSENEPKSAEPQASEDQMVAQVPSSESEQPAEQDRQHHQEVLIQNPSEDWVNEESSPRLSQKWTIGVNASGGLLAANNSQRMDRLDYNKSLMNLYTSSFGSNDAQATSGGLSKEYTAKHYLPIRFGLNLTYQLAPHFNLVSGINYAYLYSEFSWPFNPEDSYHQKLHYLGIPLGVSYQLWSANRFQLYLSGGVTLEKCLNDKPWQWSVDAAAGVEYTLTRQFGLYLEPSLGYYIDDGSSLEHYYKEHPWTPSLEVGLRLHLTK